MNDYLVGHGRVWTDKKRSNHAGNILRIHHTLPDEENQMLEQFIPETKGRGIQEGPGNERKGVGIIIYTDGQTNWLTDGQTDRRLLFLSSVATSLISRQFSRQG